MSKQKIAELYEVLKIPKAKQASFKTAVIKQIQRYRGQFRRLDQISAQEIKNFAIDFFAISNDNIGRWWPDMENRYTWVRGDQIDISLEELLKIWSEAKRRESHNHIAQPSADGPAPNKVPKTTPRKIVSMKYQLEKGEASNKPRKNTKQASSPRQTNDRLITIHDTEDEVDNTQYIASSQGQTLATEPSSSNGPLPDIPHSPNDIQDQAGGSNYQTRAGNNTTDSHPPRVDNAVQARNSHYPLFDRKGKAPLRDRDSSYQPSQLGILDTPYLSPPPTTRTAEKRKLTSTTASNTGEGEGLTNEEEMTLGAKRPRTIRPEPSRAAQPDSISNTMASETIHNSFAQEPVMQQQEVEDNMTDDDDFGECRMQSSPSVTQSHIHHNAPAEAGFDAFEELARSLKTYLFESMQRTLYQANDSILSEPERARYQNRAGMLEYAYRDITTRINAVRARRNDPNASRPVSSFLKYC